MSVNCVFVSDGASEPTGLTTAGASEEGTSGSSTRERRRASPKRRLYNRSVQLYRSC